ncbi:MAG: hypothetical protein ACFFD4_39515, partial [Candidatus Odinarchaeota archaeon]
LEESIIIPVHRTRRKAKITANMQKEAFELAKEYAIFFKNSKDSDLVLVARVSKRIQENIMKISKELRRESGIEEDSPIDYLHTFKLMEHLGINVIFRYFPDTIKSYAFYTKIHNHRVVFVNNSTNVLDLIFPLLHESVHAIRDEIGVPGEYDQEEENFCDQVANHVQFPDEYVKFVYKTISGLSPGTQVNKLKTFGEKYGHALYGIVLRIQSMFPDFSLKVGGADANLRKKFPTIGNVLFSKEDPREYIEKVSTLSPNFVEKILAQLDGISYRKLAELLGLESVLDAKTVKQELTKLKK